MTSRTTRSVFGSTPAVARRDLLKGSLALGLTPLLSLALAGRSAASAAAMSLKDLTAVYTKANPLIVDGWAFMPEVVNSMMKTFEEQYHESVTFELIPGDYAATMLNKMIANSTVDGMYIKADAAKFLDAGWITPLDTLDNIDKIKQDMIPSFLKALTYKGHLTSLPYYGGAKGMVAYNEDILRQAGITAGNLPTSWDDMYEACRLIKSKGIVETPLVMLWPPSTDGIVDAWMAETMNRGDMVVDDQFKAVLSPKSGGADTLRAWNRAWTGGLVPPNSLVLGGADARDIFLAGKAAFIVFQSWHLKTANDPQKSKVAGKVKMLPYAGQAWGLLDYAGYAVVAARNDNKKLREARAMRWAEFMGYRDKEGKILVGKQWVIGAGLSSAYQEVEDDPDVIEAQKKWMPDYPVMKNQLKENLQKIVAPPAWKALWYSEWASYVATVLSDAITGKKPVDNVVSDMAARWEVLRKSYA
jgi:hypothetical protein